MGQYRRQSPKLVEGHADIYQPNTYLLASMSQEQIPLRNDATVAMYVNDHFAIGLLDSGCTGCVVLEAFLIKAYQRNPTEISIENELTTFSLADGKQLTSSGVCMLPIVIGNQTYRVYTHIVKQLSTPIILGKSFLKKYKAIMDFGNMTIRTTIENNSEQDQLVRTKQYCNMLYQDAKGNEIYEGDEYFEPGTEIWSDEPDWSRATPEERFKEIEFPLATCEFDAEHKQQLIELLMRNTYNFAINPRELGICTAFPLKLRFKHDYVPIFAKSYPIPPDMETEVGKQVQALVDSGVLRIVRESKSLSPLLCVAKGQNKTAKAAKLKRTGVRLCIDLRHINEGLVDDGQTLMPSATEILEEVLMAKKSYFSSIDLSSAYYQMKLHEESQPYIAFRWNETTYMLTRIAMGLSKSSAQMIMCLSYVFRKLLKRKPCPIKCYMDDLLIMTDTQEEHLEVLEQVFTALEANNIRMNGKKSFFGAKKVEFLGFEITPKGYSVPQKHLEGIKNIPIPKTVKEVRAFIGSINFFKNLIKDRAKLLVPLIRLTRKGISFNFDEDCVRSFKNLKNQLISKPVMTLPNLEKHFYIATDSSMIACGAVLYQMIDGQKQPIAYYGKKFSDAEIKMSIPHKEFVAVVASWRYFAGFLRAARAGLTVNTDCVCLRQMLKGNAPLTPKLLRMKLLLAPFKFKIEHIPGDRNFIPDYISRNPNQPKDDELLTTLEDDPCLMAPYTKTEEKENTANGIIAQVQTQTIQNQSKDSQKETTGILRKSVRIQNQEKKEEKRVKFDVTLVDFYSARKKNRNGQDIHQIIRESWENEKKRQKFFDTCFPRKYILGELEEWQQINTDTIIKAINAALEDRGIVFRVKNNRATSETNTQRILESLENKPKRKEYHRVLDLMEAIEWESVVTHIVRKLIMACRHTTQTSVIRAAKDNFLPRLSPIEADKLEKELDKARIVPLQSEDSSRRTRSQTQSQREEDEEEERNREIDKTNEPISNDQQSQKDDITTEDVKNMCLRTGVPFVRGESREISRHRLKIAQQRDDKCRALINYVKFDRYPSSYGLQKLIETKGPNYFMEDGVLMEVYVRKKSSGQPCYRTVIPEEMIEKVIDYVHSTILPHLGYRTVYEYMVTRFQFRQMKKRIIRYVIACVKCSMNKPATQSEKHTNPPMKSPHVFTQWSSDAIGPFTISSKGYMHIVIFTDAASGYTVTQGVRHLTGESIVKIWDEKVTQIFGTCNTIICDNGSQYRSKVFQAYAKMHNIHISYISPFNSQSNPTERRNRDLVYCLKSVCHDKQKQWDLYLPHITLALNCARRVNGTMLSPFTHVFGRICKLPLENNIHQIDEQSPILEEASKAMMKQYEAHRLVREHLHRQWDNYERNILSTRVQTGSIVYVRRATLTNQETRMRKLNPIYQGPYIVTKVGQSGYVRVRDLRNNRDWPHSVNVRRLKVPRWVYKPEVSTIFPNEIRGQESLEIDGLGPYFLDQQTYSCDIERSESENEEDSGEIEHNELAFLQQVECVETHEREEE